MKFNKNEEAVSPVIGVILMVAITVILAAVIAAFVFGMGTPKVAPQASITITSASATTGNITLSHAGGDAIDLNKVKAIVDGTASQHNIISLLNATGTQFFTAGDNLVIQERAAGVNATLNGAALPIGTSTTNFTLAPGKVTVTLIDTDSSQQISKITATAT
ncbi:MAG: type IV pilin N-terminal domain-containing protein [Candidatus Methanoperedens sp.]